VAGTGDTLLNSDKHASPSVVAYDTNKKAAKSEDLAAFKPQSSAGIKPALD
jgi:hypothetical protein